MAVEQLQDLACWSIERHRVWCWLEAIESVFALVVCDEFAAKVVFHLLFVLLFVQTCESLSHRP